MLQRLAGNQAVAQLVEATPSTPGATAPPPRATVPTVTDVDPRARVDLLQRAIVMNPMARRFDISMDMMVEALTDLTPEAARAVRTEYRRRTTFPDEEGTESPGLVESTLDRKSTRLNSSHLRLSRMPSSA